MSLSIKALFVDFKVRHAVRLQTHQAGFHGSALAACANAAFHFFCFHWVLSCSFKSFLLKLFHHFTQDRVPAEQRPGIEHLPALRAAVLAFLFGSVPVVFDAIQAVAVSTRDGHRVSQNLQAHRTTELVLLNWNSSGSHFLHSNPKLERTKMGVAVMTSASQVSPAAPARGVQSHAAQVGCARDTWAEQNRGSRLQVIQEVTVKDKQLQLSVTSTHVSSSAWIHPLKKSQEKMQQYLNFPYIWSWSQIMWSHIKAIVKNVLLLLLSSKFVWKNSQICTHSLCKLDKMLCFRGCQLIFFPHSKDKIQG